MPRPKNNPDYNAEQIMTDLMQAVAESYREAGELKLTAAEFGISALKVRKLLITAQAKGNVAGVYTSEIYEEINRLLADGKTALQIQEITGLKKSSINGYLPYAKYPYKPDELGTNAKRTALYRRRRQLCREMKESSSEDKLWELIEAFQNYPFFTASGLPFSYKLKTGKSGSYTKELLIDHRKESKTLSFSSIRLAFDHAAARQGEIIARPKALGDIRGVSYIYPMLWRFGLIQVPDDTAEKMRGTRLIVQNKLR